jgi:hypothetical protein
VLLVQAAAEPDALTFAVCPYEPAAANEWLKVVEEPLKPLVSEAPSP